MVTRSRQIVLAAAAAVFLPQAAVIADVTIPNAGFQSGVASPWTVDNAAQETVDANVGSAGNYAMHVWPTANTWAGYFGMPADQITGVLPSTTYVFAYDVKSADVNKTTGDLNVNLTNGGWGTPTVSATQNVTQASLTDGAWHHYSFQYTPDTNTNLKIGVHGTGSTINMYFDNFAMALYAPPPPSATWTPTAAGTYSWNSNSNWSSGAYPNAAGAVANFNIDMAGNQTVNLNQATTIGTLNAGDTAGNPNAALTIASGTGGNPLVFQGATAGAATAINFTANALPNPNYINSLNVTSGVRLGGTSPLTATFGGTAAYIAGFSSLDLNGNTFTLTGSKTASFDPGVITGNGTFVENGLGSVFTDNAAYGVKITQSQPNFTGSLTINKGFVEMITGDLKAASQININGAFQRNDKYPIGGMMQIGNGGFPAFSTMPDRLNHNGVLALNGGFLIYAGQMLSPSLSGQAIVEQVKQIKFGGGQSEIRMTNPATASSTTLLANDPTNALVRQQGATVIIGGDDNASQGGTYWLAMGVVEKLKFASGTSQYMKGGGGAPGSKSMSIIPWMSIGTVYHPALEMVTYDSTNGVRCLTAAEYSTGPVYGMPATANVKEGDLNLGTNHTQTINAYLTSSWANTDIGPGSTLTITSGFINMNSGPGSIGNGTPANAGTLNFGSAEAVIWTSWGSQVNTIGSLITGSGGLTKSGDATLCLKAANAYTGKTCVSAGVLQIGDGTATASRLGNGNVEVFAGAELLIKSNVANAITDTASVGLDSVADIYGQMYLESGVNETIGGLFFNGVAQPAGTYGSSGSSATFKNDSFFVGSGIVTSLGGTTPVPEPASLAVLGLAGLLLRRRR